MLLRLMGSNYAKTLYRRREVYGSNVYHDALRWLMKITDSSGRLMRWRLRLSDLGFTPGIVHQVTDALSRIISPQDNDECPVDDKLPTYGDHENVLVTTRTRKRASTKAASERTSRISDSGDVQRRKGTLLRSLKEATNPYEDDEQHLIREIDQNIHGNDAENEDEALDEVLEEELEIFDLAMAYRGDGHNVRIADVPVKIKRNGFLGAQRYDDFCQRYSHVKSVMGTWGFSKTITEYCEDDTQRSTATS